MKPNAQQATAALAMTTRGGAAILRILTGAFFLSTALAMQISEAGATVLDGFLTDPAARSFTAAYLAVASIAMLVRCGVRPAALLLAGYVLATGYLGAGAPSTPEALEIAQIDLVLLLALLAVTLAEPRRARVFPRRITVTEASTPRPVHGQDGPDTHRNLFADAFSDH